MATKKSKHYPVVRQAELGSVANSGVIRLLRVDRELSKLNRRLYRQCYNYQVKIDLDVGASPVTVYALRNDWALTEGIRMAYDMYLKNTSEEREANVNPARWEDFKIDSGLSGVSLAQSRLHDSNMAPSLLTSGTFDLANVQDTSGNVRTFTFSSTPLANQYSILEEYDKAGNAQISPSSVSYTSPYEGLHFGHDQLMAGNLQTDNAEPPYDQNGVAATTPWVKIASLGEGPGGSQRLSTGYFDAPCGMVVLYGPNDTWLTDIVRFEVKPGVYKGVSATNMLG